MQNRQSGKFACSKLPWFGFEALGSLACGFYGNYVFFLFRDRHGFGDLGNLGVAAMMGLIIALASWQGGKFAQRNGCFRTMAFGLIGMIVALGCGAAFPQLSVQLAVLTLWTASQFVVWPALESLVTEGANGAARSHVVGIYSMVWAACSALSYFFGGGIFDRLGSGSIFWLPPGIHLAQLGILWMMARCPPQLLAVEPVHLTEPAALAASVNRPNAKNFQRMAWVANPFASVAAFTLLAMIPDLAAKTGLSITMVGWYGSIWFFGRLAAFVVLWRWTGWHYRFRWLLGGYLLLMVGFATVLTARGLWWFGIGQVAFGSAVGLLYYASLFYSMDVGEARAEQGGIHEAMMGAGNLVGPGVGALSLIIAPTVPHMGVWSVSALLAGGLAILIIKRLIDNHYQAPEKIFSMKKLAKSKPSPRVALLIESSRSYGRDLLLGIAKYVRVHGPWSIEFEEGDPDGKLPKWIGRWKWDGIIARVSTPTMAEALGRYTVPVVDLSGTLPEARFPLLRSDENLVGRMAAEHLIECGFKRFAFCGFNGTDWSELRRNGFEERIAEAGFSCRVFGNPNPQGLSSNFEYEEHGSQQDEDLKRWLQTLPKPCGLMSCNDSRGRQVLNACRELGIAVPDEVAVIGVDKDEIFCELSDLPLSSVILNAQQIGYEAAALLTRLMAGESADAHSNVIKPMGVAARRSTDVLAMEDRQVAAALRHIREHACEGLDVTLLLDSIPLSRSVLERRFAQILGISPKAEILRVRLERVCRLLTESDLSLAEVAEKTGFDNPEYMSRLFKNKLGFTPGEFRKNSAAGGFSLR